MCSTTAASWAGGSGLKARNNASPCGSVDTPGIGRGLGSVGVILSMGSPFLPRSVCLHLLNENR